MGPKRASRYLRLSREAATALDTASVPGVVLRFRLHGSFISRRRDERAGETVDLNHLHLHVRDISRAPPVLRDGFRFWKGEGSGGRLPHRPEPEAFDLAFMNDPNPLPVPVWFHFGFRLPSRKAVRALHDAMARDKASITRPLEDHGTWMSFRCTDPDGYKVEIYFE